ncbi:hypothetical protein O181_027460 [Austropuccinia psidii MF-1]|uniref:Uncharacterized protein n=1 Tax=Austropuccinia psidii MF-1 TaxID=1389203 RepID=A0A9Q3CRE6_9BASI|nr:hypothetical protein [Austropuccinia psidii MF-1]
MTPKQTQAHAVLTCHKATCRALYALRGVSPASTTPQQPTLVMLANKHTRNACLLSDPSDHMARGVPNQDALVRTPLWSMMMKAFPSGNELWERFWMISPVPSSIHLFTPPPRPPSNGHFTPQSEGSDYPDNEGWRWQEDIQAWVYCHHVLSPMGFKCQSPSGIQWSEDLFCSKQPKFHLISTLDSSELTLPPFVEPSQTNEPPIPGPSSSSEPHEDVLTRDPEPEVAPTQSMEQCFAHPTPPHSIIIIGNTPVRSPLPDSTTFPSCSPSLPSSTKNPTASSPHSHNESLQEFTGLRPTLMIP